eukprot:3554216-Amphidinium_carterae.2
MAAKGLQPGTQQLEGTLKCERGNGASHDQTVHTACKHVLRGYSEGLSSSRGTTISALWGA